MTKCHQSVVDTFHAPPAPNQSPVAGRLPVLNEYHSLLDGTTTIKATHTNMSSFTYTEAQRQALMAAAVQAKSNSYSPYSKFRVGAALLTESGKVYMGCNVENASYGGCICAERTAYVKAVSEGHKRFPAIAVATDLDYFAAPCGMCRQFMVEFGTETVVILTRAGSSDEFKEKTVGELLPESFGPKDLQIDANVANQK